MGSRKRFIKRAAWLLLVLFILMNTVAAFHAYKFTHFAAAENNNKPDMQRMTAGKKISSLFFGVDLPRPVSKIKPTVFYKNIKIQSNKNLDGWLMPVASSKGTVILFHGYGGEKSSMLDKAYVFQKLGYSTFLVDFMGAGGSEGNQTTIGFKEAAEVKSCIDYLKRMGEQNIIVFGTSMGAAAVMKAINDYELPVSSVILECPFGSMLQTVKSRFSMMHIPSFPMAYLLMFWGGVENWFNPFSHNPANYAKKIHCPVLLFYGEKDIKVSAAETDLIYHNLAAPKKLVKFPLAGHENYLKKYNAEWTAQVSGFLIQYRGSRH
jgi:uncharacterized protein